MSRRQAKLAARAAERARLAGNPRPFAGVPAEADLIALREFVSSATAPVEVAGAERGIRLCTVLPGGGAAVTRAAEHGGGALVALQTRDRSTDAAADLARALDWARAAGDGEVLDSAVTGDAPALGELLTGVDPAAIEVHADFAWWLPPGADAAAAGPEIRAAAEAIVPAHRVAAEVPGAVWWADPGERAHLRWVRPEDPAALLDALARVHAADHLSLGEGTKFAGVFRVAGVLVPVWDVDRDAPADSWAAAVAAGERRIAAALAETGPLDAAGRKSRETILSRQVTLT